MLYGLIIQLHAVSSQLFHNLRLSVSVYSNSRMGNFLYLLSKSWYLPLSYNGSECPLVTPHMLDPLTLASLHHIWGKSSRSTFCTERASRPLQSSGRRVRSQGHPGTKVKLRKEEFTNDRLNERMLLIRIICEDPSSCLLKMAGIAL